MENSITSKSKPISSKARIADYHHEGSSWTFYFEDFLCDNNYEDMSSFSSGFENPSLVSDAASDAAKNQNIAGPCLDRNKKLSFKKRKTKGALVDDALEDTASSPANSPKICYLKQLGLNNRKEKINTDNSEENGVTSGQRGDRSDQMGIVGMGNEYTELKKKGLCLVPVSMFSNYLAN